jgi:hypothetical protein
MFYLAQYATVGKEKIPRLQIIVKNQAKVAGQTNAPCPAGRPSPTGLHSLSRLIPRRREGLAGVA